MKRFKLEQSNADIISHSGLALVGQAIQKQTRLSQKLDTQVPLRHGIKHSDVMKSYLALLSSGKNDFEAINNIESEFYLMNSMGVKEIPCEATLRQRMDNSGSRKEGVSRTYKGHDGYAPMAVYLGQEGYCLDFEFREGKQHCQKDTPALLERALKNARLAQTSATTGRLGISS